MKLTLQIAEGDYENHQYREGLFRIGVVSTGWRRIAILWKIPILSNFLSKYRKNKINKILFPGN